MSEVTGKDELVFFVRSSSMVPAVPRYSFVVVVPSAEYSPGDVIVYTDEEGASYVHRIVSMSSCCREGGTMFTVKGDADENPPSEIVPLDRVVGRVVRVIGVSPETYRTIRKWRLQYFSRKEGWSDKLVID